MQTKIDNLQKWKEQNTKIHKDRPHFHLRSTLSIESTRWRMYEKHVVRTKFNIYVFYFATENTLTIEYS